ELLSIPVLGRYPENQLAPAKRMEMVAALLLHAAAGPVLMLVEDLHWADPSTVDLLGEIVARMENAPALVVCSTRPEFSAPWLTARDCQELSVEALSADDVRALVHFIAGLKPMPGPVLEEVVARTAGIPLFVEAVTRTVLESGVLRELEDRYELTRPLPQGLIPATVQDSL